MTHSSRSHDSWDGKIRLAFFRASNVGLGRGAREEPRVRYPMRVPPTVMLAILIVGHPTPTGTL